ncbi:lactonase family protein [Leptospira levettii]|uniref:Lactonase n=1 Tax=Leptospira levettii TaxID=2023178 RepID=A0ABY2MRL4_9LEPT|nr:beta-propeller fold lactonase family protein [Leptospira levettii]PKA25429.1 lactonase [Leptospira sp. mixed culture ATI2-C-A1]PJZ87979.1 lactonase [Leptospira levettii]TGL07717.1 lactonase [Leptospira levettii]TGL73441.1 lactonase [Leptospira levettii]TGM29372.1 lactonase [Leptospira levettii]
MELKEPNTWKLNTLGFILGKFIHRLHILFFILVCVEVTFHCKPTELNSVCDSSSTSYKDSIILLLATSERFQFCGGTVFQKRMKSPRFLLVSNVGTNFATSNINVFRINATTGEITQVPGSPFQLTNRPRFTLTNSAGTIVYVANVGNTSVSTLSLNPENGILSTKSTDLVLPSTPYSLVMDPSEKYLFASSETTQQIHRMAIDPSGNLSIVSPATPTSNPTAGAVGRLAFDSTGKHLYVGLTGAAASVSGIQTFSLDSLSGLLTSISVNNTSENNISVAISPNGQFVYGANYFSQDVFPFVRNQTTGTLTAQSTIMAGSAPAYTLVDPFNRFLYVANSGIGQGTISAYKIDQVNGTLTPISGSPFSSGFSPIGISIDQSGKYLYTSNTQDGNVSGYTISETGALSPIVGFPVSAGTNTFSVEIVSY